MKCCLRYHTRSLIQRLTFSCSSFQWALPRWTPMEPSAWEPASLTMAPSCFEVLQVVPWAWPWACHHVPLAQLQWNSLRWNRSFLGFTSKVLQPDYGLWRSAFLATLLHWLQLKTVWIRECLINMELRAVRQDSVAFWKIDHWCQTRVPHDLLNK